MALRKANGGLKTGGAITAFRQGSGVKIVSGISDDFHRADSGSLGPNWVNDYNSWKILSNAAVAVGADGSQAHYVGYSVTDVRVTTEVSNLAGNAAGPLARWDGAARQGYAAFAADNGDGTFAIGMESLDGADSSILGFTIVSSGPILTIALILRGDTYSVEVNGVEVLSGSDTTYPGPGTTGLLGFAAGATCTIFSATAA